MMTNPEDEFFEEERPLPANYTVDCNHQHYKCQMIAVCMMEYRQHFPVSCSWVCKHSLVVCKTELECTRQHFSQVNAVLSQFVVSLC